jgi:hypothetical protein
MDWHRHFGLLLTDFFTDSPFVVELEKDLSIKKQLLDVIVLRKGKGRVEERLPDGLEDLADHNLITFKSHQESLDDWALKELTGHYVNYRKQLSSGDEPLLPESAFHLYAVCSRFPHNLAQQVPWQARAEGVYECRRGTDCIRVIVAGQLPLSEPNALLHLFSASAERLGYGREHYCQHSHETSTLILQLLKGYEEEGIAMPYTLEDFRRDFVRSCLKDLTTEERLEALKSLPPEEQEKLVQALQKPQPREAAKPRKKPRRR